MAKTTVAVSNGTVHIENVYDGIWAIPYNITDDGIDGKQIFLGEMTPGAALLLGEAFADMILDCDTMFPDELASKLFELGFYRRMCKEMKE